MKDKKRDDTIIIKKNEEDSTKIIEREGERIGIDEFAKRVSKKTDLPQEKAKKFIHILFDTIKDGLKEENKVPIYKFGIFKKKWVPTKDGFNPQTKEKIKIPAHYSVKFSPSSKLSNEVNRKYRNLKPNVLDEILTLTGITKIDPEFKKELEKNKDLSEKYKIVKKRAIISLIVIAILFLILLAILILVPAYYVNENNQVVNFVKKVNKMFGLNKISDRLIENRKENINEEQGKEFMKEARSTLSENRKVIEEYTVKIGDTIFDIADRYWNNKYLWPDLYVLNKESVSDPDLIYPGDKLLIYEKLGDPEKFNKKQRQKIVEAFIGVYRIYRSFGEKDIENGNIKKGEKRINDARWTLYTALRYDKDLLKKYKDAIYPQDIEMIKYWQQEVERRSKNKK
ncbi:MAG TPA: HU family DNA-binding protein [Spirochaetota bacterium]|nr:HU family DNA-binding protein [Spirochaetota bacterium]HOL57690.1 HU family DNA-binding protein [Spirochaetota bacterium]HPP03526.1 HU family DNA-binding protein [Spirochaetota bacterium]